MGGAGPSRTEVLEELARREARGRGLSEDAFVEMLRLESAFNPDAVGDGGKAVGLGQLHEGAAQDTGLDPAKRRDPVLNIQHSAEYVKKLKAEFGDELVAYGAYKQGPGAVRAGGFDPGAIARMAALEGLMIPEEQQKPTKQPEPSSPGLLRKAAGVVGTVGSAVAEPFTTFGKMALWGVTPQMPGGGYTPPPVSNPEYMRAAVNILATVYPGVGRAYTAAVQGGAGAVDATLRAIEAHKRDGGSWIGAVSQLDKNDALNIAATTLGSAMLGGALARKAPAAAPGAPGFDVVPRLGKPSPVVTATARGAAEAADKKLVKTVHEELLKGGAKTLPVAPVDRAAVTEAFAKVPKEVEVNATAWREKIMRRIENGESIPKEVREAADSLIPITRPEPMTVASGLVGPDGRPLTKVVMQEVPTGEYRATTGQLLDAQMRLGNMVSELAANTLTPSHNLGNLRGLQGELRESTLTALSHVDSKAAKLYGQAISTTKEIAQATRAQRMLSRYMNPREGYIKVTPLYNFLVTQPEKRIKSYGRDLYTSLLDFARFAKKQEETAKGANLGVHKALLLKLQEGVEAAKAMTPPPLALPPPTQSPMRRLLTFPVRHPFIAAGALSAGTPLGYNTALLGTLSVRALTQMLSNKGTQQELRSIAKAPPGSREFMELAGRLILSASLAGHDSAASYQPPASSSMPPPPSGMPAMRVPAMP